MDVLLLNSMPGADITPILLYAGGRIFAVVRLLTRRVRYLLNNVIIVVVVLDARPASARCGADIVVGSTGPYLGARGRVGRAKTNGVREGGGKKEEKP